MASGGDGIVIGGGLAGSLAALALAERGWRVRQLVPAPPAADATGLSYGGVAWWSGPPGPLGTLMRQAPSQWRRWQRRHGDLGWRRCGLRLHGPGGTPWERLSPRRFSRVDGEVLGRRLPAVLTAVGVERLAVPPLGPLRLEANAGAGPAHNLALEVPGAGLLRCDRLVLAAGAGCRTLWPGLTPLLHQSWAGVLDLAQRPSSAGAERIQLPRQWQRPGLERQAGQRQQEPQWEDWIVDPGLAPWGTGWLAGQISLVRSPAASNSPPDAARMEARLRQGLAGWDPDLAALEATYRQTAVAFCTDGLPLVGPLPEQPAIWLFTGFSGAFSQVPVLAPKLAQALGASLDTGASGDPTASTRALAALGVLPR